MLLVCWGAIALSASVAWEITVDDLVERLKKQLAEALKLDENVAGKIDPVAPLFGGGLGLDSIDALELVVMLEKHYGIRILDMEAGRKAFASLDSLAQFIRERGAVS